MGEGIEGRWALVTGARRLGEAGQKDGPTQYQRRSTMPPEGAASGRGSGEPGGKP